MKLRKRLPALAFSIALFAPAAALASDACAIAPPIPTHLMNANSVADYRAILRVCHGPGGEAVATREMRLEGEPALLIADPHALTTRLERAACWTCTDASEGELAGTRMMRAVDESAEAPGLAHRGFLENAGLTHGASRGAFITGDLCPSSRPLDRSFFETVSAKQPGTPVALSISGLWLQRHFADYAWLLEQQERGAIAITWVNHSYHHQFHRGLPDERNFMLLPGVNPDYEILQTERLLIANGQVPSLFFRFPGLVSDAPLMQAARRHHLIALGADAWLAINQRPKPGSIILVHPNGNEEAGLKMFNADLARGTIARPFEPLTAAPD